MIIIQTHLDLKRLCVNSGNTALARILKCRASQLFENDADDDEQSFHMIIAQLPDTLLDIESAVGFKVLTNLIDGAQFGDPDFTPSWEWCEDHGGWFELVFIFTDDGFAHVLFVPNDEDVDAGLLAMCREHCRRSDNQSATDPPASSNGPTEL